MCPLRNKFWGPSLLKCLHTQTHQLVAGWLRVDELLVGVEEELAQGGASHDDRAARKVVKNDHRNLTFEDLH